MCDDDIQWGLPHWVKTHKNDNENQMKNLRQVLKTYSVSYELGVKIA